MTAEENKLIESYIDEIAQFGDGAMEIQSKDLQQLILIAKRESDARLKSQEDTKELVEALSESNLQIEYLQKKFQFTGSGNAVLSRNETLIKKHTK